MDSRFTGVVPPVVTPLTAEGEVDLESLDRVVEVLVSAGVDGLFVLGSSGEVAYLTDAQREAVVERVVATTAGRVPVLAGAIDTTSPRVIDQARRAMARGRSAAGDRVGRALFIADGYRSHDRQPPRRGSDRLAQKRN